jgi:serine/threonine protein kinase/tetratricopeptide (TPR) repeat protein
LKATLDRYRIEAELGAGGMGRVYRAFDPRLQRRIALKLLLPKGEHGEPHDEAVARLLREARAAAALNHPNVIAVYDVGEAEGTPFIAMELALGASLNRYVGDPSISWLTRLRWLTDIARALGAAHRVGLIHRDVKPANVILRDDGVIKVLDFGIARWSVIEIDPTTPLPTESADLLTDSRRLGTPLYMSPEQLRGEPIDHRADQFSWGVMAYELLAGKIPWEAVGSISVIGMILGKDPGPIHEGPAGAEVSSEVAAVVMQTLQKNAAARFASMDEIVAHLEPWVARGPSSSVLPPLRTGSISDEPTVKIRSPRELEPTSAPTPGPASSRRPSGTDLLPPSRPAPRTSRATPRPYQLETTQPTGSLVETGQRDLGARWPRRHAALLLLGASLLAGITLFALSPKSPPTAEPLSAAPTSPISPTSLTRKAASTTLADLPPPRECTPEATAAVQMGLRLMRQGDYEQAARRFASAADSDADCAAAHMRLAVTGHYFIPSARSHAAFERALQLRDHLSERDRGLLDAYEPSLLREPPDRDELSARVLALVEHFAGDAELEMLAASESRAPIDVRLAHAERAVAIDPQYPDGWQNLGKLLDLSGRVDEALSALDHCLRVAPLATDCLWQRIHIFRAKGRCEEMENDARRMIAQSPETSKGHELLASALASQGSPIQTIEEALRHHWDKLPKEERAEGQHFEQAKLAALAGDFDAAEGHARDLALLVQDASELRRHARPTQIRLELRLETRRHAEAAKIAEEFAERARAWRRQVDALTGAARDDLYDEARLYALSRDAGTLSLDAWRTEMKGWRARTQQSSYRDDDRTLWAIAWAMPARDSREAAAAIAVFPGGLLTAQEGASDAGQGAASAGPLSFRSAGFPYAFTGRALLLTDQLDAAIAYLRRGAAACTALEDPFLHTRTHLWLGQALERRGERSAACAAYGVILKRWGSAKPRSSTADEARKAARSLGCPRMR